MNTVYVSSMSIPVRLAKALAQEARKEIIRSIQNEVPASEVLDMAEVLNELEHRIKLYEEEELEEIE